MGWGIVSSDKPVQDRRWESAGFPRATKYDRVREPSGFGGSLRSMADLEACFELLEDAQPDSDDNWKGASGMPVFVGGKILGVVQSVPPKFNAKKLYATPTWKLLQDPDFRQALGYDERTARVGRIKAKLVKLLKPSPAAVESLAEQLGANDAMIGQDKAQQAEKLAERLVLETDIRTVIDVLRQAHRTLCEDETAEPSVQAADIVTKVAQLIVPAIYDYGILQWTRRQQEGGAALVPLPAGIRTVAEIIMAGVDGRETRFRPRQHEDDQPEGELSLPHPPECDIAAFAAKSGLALQNHLSRKFCLEKPKFRREIDETMATMFYRPVSGEPAVTPEQRLQSSNFSITGGKTLDMSLPLMAQ